MANRTFKIGLLIDSDLLPNWICESVSALEKSPFCNVEIAIRANCYNRPSRRFKNILYQKYKKWDHSSFLVVPDAFEKKNSLKDYNFRQIDISANYNGSVLEISDSDIDEIERFGLDVIINFCAGLPSGRILHLPIMGVWHFHIGKNPETTHDIFGFWEVFNEEGEIFVHLLALKGSAGSDRELFNSCSLADSLSVYRSLNSLYWKLVPVIPRILGEMAQFGEGDLLMNRPLNKSKGTDPNIIPAPPSNFQMILLFLRLNLGRMRRNLGRSFVYDIQWMILVRISNEMGISKEFDKFEKVFPPRDRFWADPFIIREKENYYIFIEELLYKENKGFISVIEMDKEGNMSESVKVLEEEFHLSFPFVFKDGNGIYMIPESKEDHSIRLYKCERFPYDWKLEKILFQGIEAVDTVVFKYRDKYWLFTNTVIHAGASLSDELYLFYSNDLLTDQWTSHPQNPIVSDVKKARAAGAIFESDGQIFRPSQNCSKHYGYGMQINRILELNEHAYKEETIESIIPEWDKNILGTHSINHCENVTVIDGWTKRSKH